MVTGTGIGIGIGRATARALHADGWHVVLVGRREEALRQTAEGGGADRLLVAPCDVTDPDAVAALFERIRGAFGRLDLLFNNAGTNGPKVAFDEITAVQWREVVDLNLSGMFFCAQGAFRLMKAQQPQGGRIVNNGSISAHAPRPHSAPYTATKHAITGLTKSISLDGRPFGIACGQIDIGNAATEMTERMSAGILQAHGAVVSEARMDVTHVAQAVVQMANLPLATNVQFMTIMATTMPFVGRG